MQAFYDNSLDADGNLTTANLLLEATNVTALSGLTSLAISDFAIQG